MKEYIPLGDVITKASVERCGDRDLPILSITMKDGLIMQDEKFKKRIASVDTTDYKVIPRGLLVQGIHIDEANFGIQDIVDAGIVSPAYKVWKVKENSIYPKYLETIMRSPRSLAYYKSKLNGSVNRRGRMSDDEFLNMPIPYVDISEQKRIIGILNQSKSIITDKNRLLDSLDTLIKARFVEMFNGKGYPEVTVHDVLETAFWLMPATPEFVVDGEIPYITSKNIKNRQIDFDNVKYISRTAFEAISANRPTMIGDILVSMIGTLGQTAVITDDRLFYGQNLYLLRLNASVIDTDFFCEFFNSNSAQHILQSKRNQSTQAYLKANHVEDLILPLPPLEQQKEFAAFVHQTDKSKAVVQQALAKDQLLFDSLMQQYFG